VIGLPQSVRILIGSTPIDMRKSIDGLTAIVQEELGEDAYSVLPRSLDGGESVRLADGHRHPGGSAGSGADGHHQLGRVASTSVMA